ncbi:MAG TPA: substrate-binding domain-containing protein [Candidatus Acidoferrum sp.]|jgi:ribose transport system substrate-binding protein|nr:substrate-binding domain-containing protein [Candidatus Acidoferrum sp.]
MKAPKNICIAGVVAMGIALAACEKPYHQQEERYILVTANVNLPYWQEAQAGLTDIGKTMGVKVEMEGPATLSPSEELSAFQKAVAQNPAGIMVSASDPALFKESINKAVLQGIPVICMDADSPDSRRVLFIGTDNFRAGQESGKRMVDLLGGQGRIILIGLPGQLNTEERVRGVNDVLKKYPGIKVVGTIDDRGDPRAAYDAVSDLLQNKKEKIDGIICLEASGGQGAADVLHRMDLTGKIKIVAFDKDPQTLDAIERGWITATVAQKPYVMAFYGVRLLDDLHHNAVHEFKDWATAPTAPLPTFVDTGTAVIDSTNLATFRKALAEHPKPVI